MDAGFRTLVKGILYADRYTAMLEDLVDKHRGVSRCYYLDVPLQETYFGMRAGSLVSPAMMVFSKAGNAHGLVVVRSRQRPWASSARRAGVLSCVFLSLIG